MYQEVAVHYGSKKDLTLAKGGRSQIRRGQSKNSGLHPSFSRNEPQLDVLEVGVTSHEPFTSRSSESDFMQNSDTKDIDNECLTGDNEDPKTF